MPDARVGAAHSRGFTAHDHGGVHARVTQDRGDHGSGGGFAVAAGDGDAVLQAHQLGQQFAARDHGNAEAAGFLHFGIRLVDSGTHHQGLRAVQIFRVVPFENGRPQGDQAIGCGGQLQVRAGDRIAEIQQHLGDTAHADAADSREVQMLP